ncbi:MAG: ATP synthase subunit b [Herpetosiphonaceae bacterium]|nr:MAG: ATP synthase subunit b [Herpetosiphonaceae bacterium]
MENLGINVQLLISQIINFGLLAFLLYKFLYNPILNALNERTRRIQESIENAEQVKQQLQRARQDYDAQLAEARREAQSIIAQATERAKAQEQELVAEARERVARMEAEARERLEQERQQLLRNLQSEIADLVTRTASVVVRQQLDPKVHQKLIEESIQQLGRMN